MEVLADALEDLGDPAAPWVRAQVAHRRDRGDPGPVRRLVPAERAPWLGLLEDVGAADGNLTTLPSGWWGLSLRSRTPALGTRPFLPPLPLPHGSFDGSFEWLEALGDEGGRSEVDASEDWTGRLARLARGGMHVPDALGRFLRSPELHERVPSVHGFAVLGADRPEIEDPDGGHLIPFYGDPDGALGTWAVWLGPADTPYAPVVAGFGAGERVLTRVVASTFEGFLYRWTVDQRVWRALHVEHRPLTVDEEAWWRATTA